MRTVLWPAPVLAALLFTIGVVNAEIMPLIEAQTKLEYGGELEYTIAVPDDCKSVLLTISARMDYPSAGGSTYVMSILLNGQPVTPEINRRASRLLNKPLNFEMASGLKLTWFRSPKWRVVYSPDFDTVQSEKAGGSRVLDVDPYKLVLDVTDFVTRGEGNTLALAHAGEAMNLRNYFKDNPSLDFYLAELSVEFSDQPPISVPAKMSRHTPDTLMVDPPQPADVQEACIIGKHGALKIALPGAELKFTTRLSYPGGGYNYIGRPADERSEDDFTITVQRTDGEARVVAEGKAYSLTRMIKLLADHIEIADTFTNLRNEVTGIKYDNHLQAPKGSVIDAYLGGDHSPGKTSVSGLENTSLYLALEDCGCGIVALDDVSRYQGVIYYDADGGGIRSNHFGLAAGTSHTFRFNIYPTARANYWDMINLARRDLDVNFTIPGGFSFSGPGGILNSTKEDLNKWLDMRGVKILSSGVWFDRSKDAQVPCYHGTHMLKATKLRQRLKDGVARLREWFPDVKYLIYIHSYINTDETAAERYPEARLITPDGQHYINPGYTKRIGIPFAYFYMTPENSYFEAMKEVVDMCLDENKIHAHGIYWDEMAWCSSRYTYKAWDGYSVEIDEQGQVTRKFAYTGLISLDAKRQLAEYILSRGKLIGNSCPTSETMTKLHFPRFAETAASWYPARSHLYTPISLGDHKTVKDWPTLIADVRSKLDLGTVYYYYARPDQPAPTITQHMFPFTPVELHSGWLLGEERILTKLPGTYTFGDDAQVKVYWYGNEGGAVAKEASQEVKQGRRLVRLDLAEGEMAVIVRADADR